MSENGKDRIVIDFIDPLFAVALNVSFAVIFYEPWFKDLRLIFEPQHLFALGTLFLAYSVVITSWVGYHRSIRRKWIDVEKRAGRLRFILDVLLLIAYFVLLTSYGNFRRELWLAVLIFVLFVAWDQGKRKEWPEQSPDDVARRGVTVFWLIVLAIPATVYTVRPPGARFEWEDWLVLASAIAATFLYRKHKNALWWKSMLVRLGYPSSI